jgi:hypothetical protein
MADVQFVLEFGFILDPTTVSWGQQSSFELQIQNSSGVKFDSASGSKATFVQLDANGNTLQSDLLPPSNIALSLNNDGVGDGTASASYILPAQAANVQAVVFTGTWTIGLDLTAASASITTQYLYVAQITSVHSGTFHFNAPYTILTPNAMVSATLPARNAITTTAIGDAWPPLSNSADPQISAAAPMPTATPTPTPIHRTDLKVVVPITVTQLPSPLPPTQYLGFGFFVTLSMIGPAASQVVAD